MNFLSFFFFKNNLSHCASVLDEKTYSFDEIKLRLRCPI